MQEKISSMITILMWLINDTTVETVVLLSKKHVNYKEYIEIGIDAEEYYKIKGDKH